MTIVNAVLNGNPKNVNYAIDFIRNNLRTILKLYVSCVLIFFILQFIFYYIVLHFFLLYNTDYLN